MDANLVLAWKEYGLSGSGRQAINLFILGTNGREKGAAQHKTKSYHINLHTYLYMSPLFYLIEDKSGIKFKEPQTRITYIILLNVTEKVSIFR